MMALVLCALPAFRARMIESTIGTKKQSDLPEPVPVDGLRLMAMEPYGSCPQTEKPTGRLIEIARNDQVINCLTLKITRIKRQKSVWPETPGIVLAIDLGLQVVRPDGAERPREAGVGIDQMMFKTKGLH
jgi:hypothetical protein